MHGDLIDKSRIQKKAQIITLTEARLCYFPVRLFQRARRQSAELDRLYQARLARQSRGLVYHRADIARKTPPERVASFLLECRKRLRCGEEFRDS